MNAFKMATLLTPLLLYQMALAAQEPNSAIFPGMDAYPISYWCGPPASQTNEARYDEIAEAGFNLVMPPIEFDANDPSPSALNMRILDLSQARGLKVLVADPRMSEVLSRMDGEWEPILDAIIDTYQHHPALYGYYVVDEPNADDFQRLGAVIARIQEKDPKHPGLINLFPNYATVNQLGTRTYEEHIERYIREVNPAVVSYDHYHFLKDQTQKSDVQFTDERSKEIYDSAFSDVTGIDRAGFFDNLETVRQLCERYGVPFCVVVLMVEHGPYRLLTEAELRWEAFQCLAYGSTALIWFTYWTPPDEEVWHYQHGVIEYDGTRHEHYDQVKRVNSVVQMMGLRLRGRTNQAVFHVGEENESVTPFTSRGPISSIAGGRLTVGFFDDDYVLVVNKDYRHPEVAVLNVDSSFQVYRLDKVTGKDVPLNADDGILKLSLDPGDAELLHFMK